MHGSLGSFINTSTGGGGGGGSSLGFLDVHPWLRHSTLTVNGGNNAHMRFQTFSDDNFRMNFFTIPSYINLGVNPSLNLRFYNALTDTTAENYVLQFEMAYRGVGDDGIAGTFDETSSNIVPALLTQDYQDFSINLNAALMTAGDNVTIVMTRFGNSDPNDTRIGNLLLTDIFIRFTIT